MHKYNLSNEELGCLIRNKDHEAFHTLYVAEFENLVNYAYRYVFDRDESQDIVQSAFLQLWVSARKIDPKRDVTAYLFAIVHNLCCDYLRRLSIADSNHDMLTEAMLFMEICEDGNVSPELKANLEKALRSLPGQGYEILMRHVVEAKKNSEIAAELGISENTVKTHLQRALRALRRQLLMIIFTF